MHYEWRQRFKEFYHEPGALPRHVLKEVISHRRPGFGQLIGRWGRKPDFLVIGTQKGGTTSLYSYLAMHPMVHSALIKEVHYFDFYHDCGDAWYQAHFPQLGLGGLTGEASPGYMYNPYAPARAAAFAPDLKLIVMLRDPVKRALSHHEMSTRRGREHLTFSDAIWQEPERLAAERHELGLERAFAVGRSHRNHSYLSRGHYAEQLKAWLEHFPRERVLVVKSEQFFAQPERVHAEALQFLGLPARPLRRYPNRNGWGRAALDPGLRERLEDYFRPHNAHLEQLLQRPFWL